MWSEKLVVHHIGARGPTQAFPTAEQFERSVINVLYEADERCIAELEQLNRERTAKVIIVNRCISGKGGRRTFCDAHHGYGSSLLEANPQLASLNIPAHWIDYDYTVYEAISAKERRTIDTITLDDLVASDASIPPPDFLSLDTQGSELEIFQGAPLSLGNTLCIVTEVEFMPIYDQQPLFGDVCTHLAKNDFLFAKLYPMLSGSLYRGPLGLRGEGMPVTTDALFLRNPQTVVEVSGDCVSRHVALRKLAFFSILFGFIEHALWALKLDNPSSGIVPPKILAEPWYEFVHQFKNVADKYPVLLPDTFAERHSGAHPLGRDGFARIATDQFTKLETSVGEMLRLLKGHGMDQAHAALMRQTGVCLRRLGLPVIEWL